MKILFRILSAIFLLSAVSCNSAPQFQPVITEKITLKIIPTSNRNEYKAEFRIDFANTDPKDYRTNSTPLPGLVLKENKWGSLNLSQGNKQLQRSTYIIEGKPEIFMHTKGGIFYSVNLRKKDDKQVFAKGLFRCMEQNSLYIVPFELTLPLAEETVIFLRER